MIFVAVKRWGVPVTKIDNKGVQQIAETISDVLLLDVTIVDSDLIRVAGTGSYKNRIGERLPPGSGYEFSIKSRQATTINKPGKNQICYSCTKKSECQEKAHMLSPINLNGQVIAIIGITAFTESQKQDLTYAEEKYRSFIKKMSELLADSFSNEQIILEKTKAYAQVSAIVNSVYEGILAVDDYNEVIACNDAVRDLLDIRGDIIGQNVENVVPELPFEGVITTGTSKLGHEQYFSKVGIHCLVNMKPIKMNNKVVGAVATVRDTKEIEKLAFRVSGNTAGFSFNAIISKNNNIKELKEKAKKVSQTDSTVLIRGESGTGKELYARAIHSASPRWKGPFVPVHCGAIPETLLESELFGYESGAFTGAKKGGKIGKFELAEGGTIFLDEIGDMPIHLQTKLLRVMQDGTFERIGSPETIKIDVRVLAATHQPLEEFIEKNKFRRDLFYRLNVVPLFIPALRERREDISLLLNHFLNKYANKLKREQPALSRELMSFLEQYSWPGNVRELENVAEYFININEKGYLDLGDLPKNMKDKLLETQDYQKNVGDDEILPLEELEKRSFEKAVKIYGISEQGKQLMAGKLGVSRATVYRKLKKYGLI
ncbi:putative sigma54 specific transcriptional regulator [Natranaerobius thermophilus JW/NM-WN-LF]|uniref:Putative sigma54 specific transcriptional regulator n=1 Tax=Natranaerobius thermophilus (strain ATCC BAA-1301 / DSM 18059 / JW/NM-WN-LF) TaxID=457570 RepID=B2A8I7_NATTJ|nr:putative sigma54 specific transcriptional regulator [Natranaerobius thermophilus JW/NM-WN-LF]